ncbi:MAG: endonuclease/exonuclease/phosphatase family protein [Pseudoflavonifractor sp.]|nr:endonuclease/exonuclease/phosphatase family protein [Alloprevotella sp.]MCM1116958.1 endonuclease/exonuclease/phosphatase family protein [Pseudoflavonifractor sp.]
MNIKHIIFAAAVAAASVIPAEAREVAVMQFNIWQEGTSVAGGYEALADEIARWEPDIVMLSEVRNYHGSRFCDRIVESLAARGIQYHSFYSTDTGLLSRTAITDTATIYPYGDDHGSAYKLITEIDGQRVAAYTAHLDYLNDTYYEPRGYDGNNWEPIAPVTDPEELTRRNLLSLRDEAAEAIAADVAREQQAGSIIFLGGDMNEPSGQDWTEATASMADHRGVVIDWPSIRILLNSGLIDAYRHHYPDPATHPGYTYPSSNPDAEVKRLSWALTADERERIDYIFFLPDARLTPESIAIIGPQDDIIRGERTSTIWGRRDIIAPLATWPSDHRALLARFRLSDE